MCAEFGWRAWERLDMLISVIRLCYVVDFKQTRKMDEEKSASRLFSNGREDRTHHTHAGNILYM